MIEESKLTNIFIIIGILCVGSIVINGFLIHEIVTNKRTVNNLLDNIEFNVKENCKIFNNSYYHSKDTSLGLGTVYGCKLNMTGDFENDEYIKESIIALGSMEE